MAYTTLTECDLGVGLVRYSDIEFCEVDLGRVAVETDVDSTLLIGTV